MAHMGAYSPDEMKGLHWQWHQRAALRICAAMQQHDIWDILVPRATSSSATPLPASAAGPLPGGKHATDTGPSEPAADQRPAQGVGGQPPQYPPPPRAGRDDTGPRHGHRPPNQPGPCTTGFPSPAATRAKRQGAEGALQQREHDTSGPGADAQMKETSGPQECDDPLPAAATCSMPQQQEPSTGYVPGGHPGTPPGHPSVTSATLDQDRETMPPHPPGHRSGGAGVPSTT